MKHLDRFFIGLCALLLSSILIAIATAIIAQFGAQSMTWVALGVILAYALGYILEQTTT